MANVCCTNIKFLGCFTHCDSVNTGLNAIQTGNHTIQYYFLDGLKQEIVNVTIGNPIIIPAIFNEDAINTIKILNPDGSVFVDGVADCFTIRTLLQIA